MMLSKSASAKTAFLKDLGKFQFLWNHLASQMPQSTFRNMILHGTGSFALAFLNDVLIFSSTPEDHIEHIGIVLKHLKEAGLKLKKSKCCFFHKQLSYLGHVICSDGLTSDPNKTKAIEEMPAPRNVRQYDISWG